MNISILDQMSFSVEATHSVLAISSPVRLLGGKMVSAPGRRFLLDKRFTCLSHLQTKHCHLGLETFTIRKGDAVVVERHPTCADHRLQGVPGAHLRFVGESVAAMRQQVFSELFGGLADDIYVVLLGATVSDVQLFANRNSERFNQTDNPGHWSLTVSKLYYQVSLAREVHQLNDRKLGGNIGLFTDGNWALLAPAAVVKDEQTLVADTTTTAAVVVHCGVDVDDF